MSYIQSLTVFLHVVEEGSFSATAKRLDLTQPTVSFHIDSLEKNFGCPLFTRTSKGVTLTIYGEKLYETTRTINNLISTAHNQIQAMSQGSAGQILLGASTIPADYILPPLLAGFLDQHPDLTFSLTTGDSQTILELFSKGELPIAIVGAKPPEHLASYPLWVDKLVLVAHPEYVVTPPSHSIKDWLLSLPFILRKKSSGTGNAALTALSSLGIAPDDLNVVLEAGSNQAVKAAIMNKIGVGFVSQWAIEIELAAGKLTILPVPGLTISRQFYAVSQQPLRPACLDLFWRYLLNQPSEQPLP